MNDVIIHAKGLSKLYKLYSKPHFRFLDMLGLLRRKGAYQEHWAIRDLDLTIRRGEKVAFIGRNGAGKSTLLRLITGVTQPTSGHFEVSQGAHALLQIGTGFHPDFTGRENALAYLAHLAVTGEPARIKVEEIIAFAELEQYIDQPVKTYSSGMMARLMFATSTAISPELLVLDEILGVGDAYFGNKSFERIRELSEHGGTTVLLVSHDVYSAAKLCNRMIWMDRGRILLDGRSDEVIRAYEQSIRVQEESRLRTKALAARQSGMCLLELASTGESAPQGRILVKSVRLLAGQQVLAEYPMLPGGELLSPSSGFEPEYGDQGLRIMGESTAIKRCRLAIDLSPEQIQAAEAGGLSLELAYFSSHDNRLVGELWHKDACRLRGELALAVTPVATPAAALTWPLASAVLATPDAQVAVVSSVHGSGRVWLDDIELCAVDGDQPGFVFTAGESLSVRCRYRNDSGRGEAPVEFLFAFHRDGVTDIARLTAPAMVLAPGWGELRFSWAGLQLGVGTFTLTVFAVRPGYFEVNDGRFYTINDDVYFAFNRGIEFQVTGNGGKFGGANTLLPMHIDLVHAQLEPQ